MRILALPVDSIASGNRAVAALTDELKSLSADELRSQSDRYKALLEARELEDCLFSGQ